MKKKIILATLVLILALAGIFIYLNTVILPTKVKTLIIKTLAGVTHKNVSLGSVNLHIFKGLLLKDLKVYDDTETYLSAREIYCRFLFLPIFKKQLIIPTIGVNGAVLFVERRHDNTLNIADLLPAGKQGAGKFKFEVIVYRIKIANSRIDFQDDTLNPVFQKSLDKINLVVQISLPASIKFSLRGILGVKTAALLQASGEFKIPRQEFNVKVTVKDLLPGEFAGYCQDLGFTPGGGTIDALINLALKDLVISADLTGQTKSLMVAKDKTSALLNSQVRANLRYGLTDKNLQYAGTMVITDSLVLGPAWFNNINAVNGQVNFDQNGLSSQNLNANILGIPWEAKFTLNNFNNPVLNINALSCPDLGIAQQILKDKFNFVIPAQLQGKGGLSLWIKALLPSAACLQINGALDLSDAQVKFDKIKYPLQQVSGRIDFTRDSLKWQDLNFQYNNTAYKTSGALANFTSPAVQLALSSRDLSLDSEFNLKDKLINILRLSAGYANSKLSLAGNLDISDPAILNADISGASDIDLKDLKILFMVQESIKHFPIPLRKSPKVIAEGDFLEDLSKGLDAVKPEGILQAKFSLKGALADIKKCELGVALSAPYLCLYGLKAADFSLNYNQASGLGDIPIFRLSLYDGTLLLDAKFNFNSQNLPYTINASMQDVKIEKLKLDTAAKDKDIAGTIKAEVKVSGFSNDVSKISGAGEISIIDGKLWELNLFKGFGKLLFAKDFTHIIFREGYAGFLIKDKYITSDNLRLKSDFVDLTGSCRVGFDSSLDAAIRIEVLDENAPLAGTFKDVATAIIGQAGKFGTIKISGTLGEPKYKFSPAVLDILNSLKDSILKSIRKE